MNKKKSTAHKVIKIIITVVLSLIILVALITGGIVIYETTPHKRHFNKIILVSNNKFDGRYLYHASNNSGKVFIIRTETDLRDRFKSSKDDIYDLGEQELKVKATGIEIYRTDISGFFLSYPTITYEYVSE